MTQRLLPVAFLLALTPAIFGAPAAKPLAAAPAPKPPPVALPVRVAAPAFVDAVTFNIDSTGDKHVLTVISAPGLVRIDAPLDRLSILYDPLAEHYTGLEHSNFTYWEFTWPEVRDAVENTARYATRLRDMGPELLEENALASTQTNGADAASAAPSTDTAGSDASGYVWHTDIQKKRVAGFDCVHWIGETVAGESIDAWCAPGLQPEVEHALTILQTVNEPIALVPVRNFVPPLAFVAWKALTKGGVTPVLLTWGSDTEANRFALVSAKQREGKLSYFQVPRDYIKTTLVTMDGIGNQKPITTRVDEPQPLVPHHDPDLPPR